MKLADRGAGRRRNFLRHCGVAACGVALSACGGTAPTRTGHDTWLVPVFGISGATLTNKLDPTGFPLPGGNETFISFMFPVAVVAQFGSIFVADAGYGRLFRYERNSGLMAAVPGVRVGAGSRLQTGGDGTVYVLDAMGGEIRRHSMHGATLPTLHPRLPTSRYLDFAVDGLTGRVFAVDPMHQGVDQIEPMGRIALSYLDFVAAGPIAIDGGTLLVADSQCKCVSEWRNGRLIRRLAAGEIRLPRALATEGGEVYVLDGFDRSISRVFVGGLETILPADLNLISPEQISVSGGMMYVADGASRTVAVFRIRRRH